MVPLTVCPALSFSGRVNPAIEKLALPTFSWLTVIVAAPVFDMEIGDVLGEPAVTLPKLRLAGVKLNVGELGEGVGVGVGLGPATKRWWQILRRHIQPAPAIKVRHTWQYCSGEKQTLSNLLPRRIRSRPLVGKCKFSNTCANLHSYFSACGTNCPNWRIRVTGVTPQSTYSAKVKVGLQVTNYSEAGPVVRCPLSVFHVQIFSLLYKAGCAELAIEQ